jgi:negative regulator of replication initiation
LEVRGRNGRRFLPDVRGDYFFRSAAIFEGDDTRIGEIRRGFKGYGQRLKRSLDNNSQLWHCNIVPNDVVSSERRRTMMPTIRVDNDVWGFLQSKAKPFEDSPNDVLRRELGLDPPAADQVEEASSDVSRKANSRQHDGSLTLANKDYTHHRVTRYRLDGEHFPARTFRDVLVGVSSHLRREHLSVFDEVALGLHGKKRMYFSRDPKNLKYPGRVPESNLFVETNLNANLIAGICATLIKALGHDVSKFEIE